MFAFPPIADVHESWKKRHMGLWRRLSPVTSETRNVGGGVLIATVAVLLTGCATLPSAQAPLPTYEYTGIELITSTRGVLYRSGSCVLMRVGEGSIVPIWPNGTRMSEEGLALPAANGGALLRFGEVAYLHGGHINDLAGNGERFATAASACGEHGFLVNSARTQRLMEAAAPNPPYTSGILVRRGTCTVIENVEGVLLPIWPLGTVVTGDTVATPNLRGHAPLVVGGRAGVHGRYVHADDGSLQRAAGAEAARCAQRGMIVEKANRVYIAQSAAEQAAMSDAVLVVELVELNPSEPLQDGFLTTMVTRVVEPLTGGFRSGEMIKLRHRAGRDPVGGWQVTPHDPLFGTFGQTSPKPGHRLLLFVNQDLYRQMAEVDNGRPVPGYIGVGGGIYRLEGARIINEGQVPMAETLDEIRREVQKR